MVPDAPMSMSPSCETVASILGPSGSAVSSKNVFAPSLHWKHTSESEAHMWDLEFWSFGDEDRLAGMEGLVCVDTCQEVACLDMRCTT